MLELYGNQWESQYGHVDGDQFQAWVAGLDEHTDTQIRHAIHLMDQEGSDWPPNLIKFRRFCRTPNPSMYVSIRPALPGKLPRFSVRRIEQAKQRKLTGDSYDVPEPNSGMVADWDDDDEFKLKLLIDSFELIPDEDPAEANRRMNEHVDYVEFSHGSQHDNTRS